MSDDACSMATLRLNRVRFKGVQNVEKKTQLSIQSFIVSTFMSTSYWTVSCNMSVVCNWIADIWNVLS